MAAEDLTAVGPAVSTAAAPTGVAIPTVADIRTAAVATTAALGAADEKAPTEAAAPMEACTADRLRRAIPAQPEVGPGRVAVMGTTRPDGIHLAEAPAAVWRQPVGVRVRPIKLLPTGDSTPSAATTVPQDRRWPRTPTPRRARLSATALPLPRLSAARAGAVVMAGAAVVGAATGAGDAAAGAGASAGVGAGILFGILSGLGHRTGIPHGWTTILRPITFTPILTRKRITSDQADRANPWP